MFEVCFVIYGPNQENKPKKRTYKRQSAHSELSFGELAVNTFDRKFFMGSSQDEVLDFPIERTFFYETATAFQYDLDAGAFGATCSEYHFKFGDRLLLRDTLDQLWYIFLLREELEQPLIVFRECGLNFREE
jgi:hypothetical protein